MSSRSFRFAFLLALMLGSGCSGGGTGTDTGNPNPTDTTLSGELLDIMCSKLNECYPSLSEAQCVSAVKATSSIDTELGLDPGFGTYQEVIDGEKAGSLVVNLVEAVQCEADIGALACSDPAVTGAYNTGSPTDLSNVNQLPASSVTHCGSFFL